jgi:XTP/dITP diphosphohydrolase
MKRLVIATHNLGKSIELTDLLSMSGTEILCLKDFPWVEDIEETGKTFRENALLKAETAVNMTELPAIGDDSGMEILALDMYPGIYSARCAGEGASDEVRMQFILDKMKGIEDRRVRFNCTLCFMATPVSEPVYFEGETYGRLLTGPRGIAKPSLPFDRIFFYDKIGKTFAEMTPEEKDAVSHRGRAARKARSWLEKNL